MVEKLTADIIKAAEEYIAKIDSLGGALAAIERGYPQQEIQESAYRYQREVEAGQRVVVGVNKFDTPYAGLEILTKVSTSEAERQVAALEEVKKERDTAVVRASLEDLRRVASGTENTMPAFLRCVESYATLGEISDALREVFGVQPENLVI